MKTDNMLLICRKFWAAKSLFNQRRDTLFYGAVVAAAAADLYFGGSHSLKNVLDVVAVACFARETLRCGLWMWRANPMRQDKELSWPVANRFNMAALSVQGIVSAVAVLFWNVGVTSNLAWTALCMVPSIHNMVYGTIKNGGVRQNIAAYKDIFDWPSKKRQFVVKAFGSASQP